MNLTNQEIEKFNTLYEDACKKMKGLIILDGYRPSKPNLIEKVKIKRAIDTFKKALALFPEHFPSLFFIGKLYQRRCKYEKALSYFEEALKYEHENHSLPLEAALTAMHLNYTDKAMEYSAEAVKRSPENVSVLGNHSMNLLIIGKDEEAVTFINKALIMSPDDEINLRIKERIEAVIAGNEERPLFENSIG